MTKHVQNEKAGKGYGLFYSYGWKRNLRAVLISFGICILLQIITASLIDSQVIDHFDAAMAIMPILGLFFGIWGVIGCLIGRMILLYFFAILAVMSGDTTFWVYVALESVRTLIYCALPCFLWYAIRLRKEDRVRFPRLDTASHVVKYYLIMVVDVAVYVLMNVFSVGGFGLTSGYTILDWIALFTQYLDVVLILGIPLMVVISRIRYKTVTINERLVLAFLFIGVLASVLAGFLVYRTTRFLNPALFDDYEAFMESMEDFTEESAKIYERYEAFWNRLYIVLAIMLNALLWLEMILMSVIEKKVTKPLLRLTNVMEDYTSAESFMDAARVKEECGPYKEGYGEVSTLTTVCSDMVTEIDEYTRNLEQVTEEKHRIGTELDIASRIQKDMLPNIFPPFPDRPEIELFASMQPAREVGGDFYDFYFIDQDHLVLTIADVSDKGIPASLFMVISKTLLQDHAHNGGSPKEILTYVNHQLCQTNTSFMFCTVWLGILDLRTGEMVAANAGHEYPILRGPDGVFSLVEAKHDPPLGLRDGFRYHEYNMKLSPGDCLFQYTDGVTEATNTQQEMFGEELLTKVLNEAPDDTPEALINRTHDAIHSFVKEAAQFDDITMLCVKYMGNISDEKQNRAEITVPARIDQLEKVTDFIEEKLEGTGCESAEIFSLTLAVEEIFVNIASYAYDSKEGDARIIYSFDPETRKVEIVFMDQGIPFDPTTRTAPEEAYQEAGNRQVGGLGIHIVKKTMDEVKYSYAGGNVLTITKKI